MSADDGLDGLNRMEKEAALEQLQRCCGSDAWCQTMVKLLPFADESALHQAADRAMDALEPDDWRQAFDSHPQIGDLDSLRMKFAGNKEWSGGEQSGVALASEEILKELARGNAEYLAKFGHIFIVCATGKSAAEMLGILRARLPLAPEEEFRNAAAEQRKITHLRLDKLRRSST